MNIYLIASTCCIVIQQYPSLIRSCYKVMKLKSQHKKDKNIKFPEKALQRVSTRMKRHSTSLPQRCK